MSYPTECGIGHCMLHQLNQQNNLPAHVQFHNIVESDIIAPRTWQGALKNVPLDILTTVRY